MTKLEHLKTIALVIRQTWPDVEKIEIAVRQDNVEIAFFNCEDYNRGTTLLRELGVGIRNKNVGSCEHSTWCYIEGESEPGIHATAYCGGLPPTCRIEEYVEKVSVTETVTKPDFIEVKRKRVVCE